MITRQKEGGKNEGSVLYPRVNERTDVDIDVEGKDKGRDSEIKVEEKREGGRKRD